METSVVSSTGQIVIPVKIRKKVKIKNGTRVAIIEQEDSFEVKPIDEKYFERLAGILGTKGKLTKALLEERRKDREREDARSR